MLEDEWNFDNVKLIKSNEALNSYSGTWMHSNNSNPLSIVEQ